MNLIDKGLIADMLSKYDKEKQNLKKKYIIKRLISLIMTITGMVLVIVGSGFGEYLPIFIVVAVILCIIAFKIAKSSKSDYRDELASIWANFIKDEFIDMIVNSLEGGEYGSGVDDSTFNYLKTGSDITTFTHGALGSTYNDERIVVANYYGYGTRVDKRTGMISNYDVFDGIAVIKETKKEIESEIVITPDWLRGLMEFDKTSMDNSNFNKQFKTYTRNKMDAYISLTPAVMESMLDLTKDFKVTAIVIKEGGIYVFIDKEKLIFDMQKERLKKTEDYKKALKYMTVEHVYQNLSDFVTKYIKIVDSINKIKV